MEFLKPPGQLHLGGDTSRNWCLFKQKFELFVSAATPQGKTYTGPTKTALLLSVVGDDGLEVFNNFDFGEGESKQDYDTVIRKFDEYCASQLNEVHERYVFRQRIQAQGEPAEQFIRDLRRLAQSCNFGTLAESMIRDQIVFGTNNGKVREKLLRDNKLTLTKA